MMAIVAMAIDKICDKKKIFTDRNRQNKPSKPNLILLNIT